MAKKIARSALLLLAVLAAGIWIGRRSNEVPAARAADGAIEMKAAVALSSSSARVDGSRSSAPTVQNSAAKAPLPPPGMPLKQTLAELQARTDAGDASAASRLYRDMQRCAERRQILRTMPDVATRILDEKLEKLSPQS